MVEKSIVLETIKKMYDSGLSDEVISSTLKDIGLSDSEIKETINEAKGIKAPVQQAAQPTKQAQAQTVAAKTAVAQEEAEDIEEEPELHEKIAVATAQKVKQQLDENREQDAMVHAATHVAVAGYDARLEEIVQKISLIEKKFSAMPISQDSSKAISLDKKVSAIESDLSEVKALSNALKSLLEKILDTNRSILTELEERKQ
jgi:hypothetical protein